MNARNWVDRDRMDSIVSEKYYTFAKKVEQFRRELQVAVFQA